MPFKRRWGEGRSYLTLDCIKARGAGWFHFKERHYGAFSRSFTLPASVDTEKIEANYVNGVLAIELPKRAELKPKQIKVNVAKTLKAA